MAPTKPNPSKVELPGPRLPESNYIGPPDADSSLWRPLLFLVLVMFGAGASFGYSMASCSQASEPDRPMAAEAELAREPLSNAEAIRILTWVLEQYQEAERVEKEEPPASRGPIRWAANRWNAIGHDVHELILKAKKQGHIDLNVKVKGPKGKYTLLQFDLEVKLPK